MNPRKAKELLDKIDVPVSQDCLRDLTDYYWGAVHREMVSLGTNHIRVPMLGTFSIKSEKTLLKTIARYEKLVAKPRVKPPKTMVRYALYKANEEKLVKLYALLNGIYNERVEKKKITAIRKDVRKAKEDLGQQSQDTGGVEEQSIC